MKKSPPELIFLVIWTKGRFRTMESYILLAFEQIKDFEQKNCFYCNSTITKKNGKKDEKQLYKCLACGRQFIGGNRLNSNQIWIEYVEGKQTYQQLAQKYHCSTKTIQRKIDSVIF